MKRELIELLITSTNHLILARQVVEEMPVAKRRAARPLPSSRKPDRPRG